MISYTALPYNKTPLSSRLWKKCKNRSPAGEPLPPHAYCDPVCPEDQHGIAPCSSFWKHKVDHDSCPIIRWYDKDQARPGRATGAHTTRNTTRTSMAGGTGKETLRGSYKKNAYMHAQHPKHAQFNTCVIKHLPGIKEKTRTATTSPEEEWATHNPYGVLDHSAYKVQLQNLQAMHQHTRAVLMACNIEHDIRQYQPSKLQG